MLDRWKYLAEQQKKTSLISCRRRYWKNVVIKTLPNQIVIRPSNKRWFEFVGWLTLGLFTIFASVFYGDDHEW